MGKETQSGECWVGGGWMVFEACMKGYTSTGGRLFDSQMTDKRRNMGVFEVKLFESGSKVRDPQGEMDMSVLIRGVSSYYYVKSRTASSTGSTNMFLREMGPLSRPPGTGLSPRC